MTPAKRFSGFEEDGIKVGVTHDLPVGATPFEYFSLILPREFWETFSTETNKYAAKKQTEKGVDKQWHDTSQDMQFFFFYSVYIWYYASARDKHVLVHKPPVENSCSG